MFEISRCLLTERRRERGYSQQDVAEGTGIPKSVISEYANNKRVMSFATAYAIAKFIGCSMESLYELKPRTRE